MDGLDCDFHCPFSLPRMAALFYHYVEGLVDSRDDRGWLEDVLTLVDSPRIVQGSFPGICQGHDRE